MTLAIVLLIIACLLALAAADQRYRHRAEVRRTRRRVRRFTGER